MYRLISSCFVGVLCVLLGGSVAALGPHWPGWRGGNGSGISDEVTLPDRWSPDTNIAWKTPIPGRAHSSPIVWGDQVFLTTAIEGDVIPNHAPLKHTIEGSEWRSPDAVGGDRRHALQVMALDAPTGKIQWTKTAYEGPMYDDRHKRGSYAAPTPVTDGERVYAYFGTEGLYAYRLDGTPVWNRQLGKVAGLSVGVSTSPLLYGRLVIVQADEDNGDTSFITAVDSATGADVWRVQRKKMPISWATPLLTTAGGRPELITTTDTSIIAYDPATGRELWSEPGLESYAVPSPVVSGRRVIISTGNPKKITIALTLGELRQGETRRVWEYRKGSAYVVSPTAHDGLVYVMSDAGILTCLNAETGAVVYEGGRPPVPSSFFSSPVVFGGHLYMTSEEGETFVIKTGADHTVVRTNSVGEPVYASPALANGTIYMRGVHHLFAIRAPRSSRAADTQEALVVPPTNPAAVVQQRVGLTDIEVRFNRPSVKGRAIFGSLVPYDQIWRTGADTSTKITFSTPVTFQGAPVPAGTYELFSIPGREAWTIILQPDARQWGSYAYDPARDVARVRVVSTQSAEVMESFAIDFRSVTHGSATMTIAWDRTRVPATITVDVVGQVVPRIQEAMKGTGRKPYYQAAMFYFENNLDLAQAAEWMAAALAEQPGSFVTSYRLALILEKKGDTKAALAAAEQSLAAAKTATNRELREEYVRLNTTLIDRLQRRA